MKKHILCIISILIFGSLFINHDAVSKNLRTDLFAKDSLSNNLYDIQKLKLYPNPASSYLFIEYDVIFLKEAKIQIYNSIGAVVYTKTLEDKKDNFKISVSDFKNGLYFCSLQIDGKLLNTKKILINH